MSVRGDALRAVIDIGSNSVLLLMGRVGRDGGVHVVDDIATVTRLSQGVGSSGRFAEDAVSRTLRTLAGYRTQIETAGASLCVAAATEGVRMAADSRAFLAAAEEVLGQPVRVLSGEDEAELSYQSIAVEHPSQALHVLDVGGASTELAFGVGMKVRQRSSVPVGSVRLTERYMRGDPPTFEELSAVEAAAREALTKVALPPTTVLYGLAGTVTTAAALMLGLEAYDRARVDNTRFSRSQVSALRAMLATETLATRCARPCLPPGRADVIIAGLTIVQLAMEHLGADTLICRDRGHRYALLARST